MSTSSQYILAGAAVACYPWTRHVLALEAWREMAARLGEEPGLELLALWADTIQVHALFHDAAGGEFLLASTDIREKAYPALSPFRPGASRFERAIHDLFGHHAEGGVDSRPWLDHGQWGHAAPLAPRTGGAAVESAGVAEPPAFLPVEAADFHQLPLGPVLPEILESAHFRISAQGEEVLRLEVRLGYLHKGTLGLMRGKSPRAAARFAARLSGEATVAHAIAFARAAEAAAAADPPPRAHALRAVMAEIERIASHLGDCGGIAGAAGAAMAAGRFGWHQEAMRAAGAAGFGHRLMMDCVIPGGIAVEIAEGGGEAILAAVGGLEAELAELTKSCGTGSGLAERLAGTGVVTPELAALLAAGGPVGRAAGRAGDLRRVPGYPPYDQMEFATPLLSAGDVEARMGLRLEEIGASIRLLQGLLAGLPEGPVAVQLSLASGEGIGWAEGARGDIWHWLRLDGGQIGSVFMRDPAWQHWPLLEAAMAGGSVDDFVLVLASFNCAVSGVDL